MPGLDAALPSDAMVGPSVSPAGARPYDGGCLGCCWSRRMGLGCRPHRFGNRPRGRGLNPAPVRHRSPPPRRGHTPLQHLEGCNFNITVPSGVDGREDQDRIASVLKGPFGKPEMGRADWDFAG